jgi:hypothetical protein
MLAEISMFLPDWCFSLATSSTALPLTIHPSFHLPKGGAIV